MPLIRRAGRESNLIRLSGRRVFFLWFLLNIIEGTGSTVHFKCCCTYFSFCCLAENHFLARLLSFFAVSWHRLSPMCANLSLNWALPVYFKIKKLFICFHSNNSLRRNYLLPQYSAALRPERFQYLYCIDNTSYSCIHSLQIYLGWIPGRRIRSASIPRRAVLVKLPLLDI